MKFGDLLQKETFAPWRLSYIQYNVLKSELKCRQLDHGWKDSDEHDFIELLQNELEKVYDFVTAKLGEVEARISYCERTLQTFMNNSTWSSKENWGIMDDALTEILFDVNDLTKFTRLNYIGFQKILKKHDKWTGLTLQQDFVPRLRSKPLDNQRFDVAIVFISALHDVCRRHGQPHTGNAAAGGDQNAFERATAKYWIHPDNVTEVKSIIMLHLPVLVFNQNKRYEPSDSAISSVYFDNTDFDLYTGRLQRDEGAEAIRFRWYGPMTSNSAFIERKTHHAPWLNGASVKDRFRIDVNEVPPFVSGSLTPETIGNAMRTKGTEEKQAEDSVFIADGVQKSFKEKQLQSMIRIFYNRTAFQLPGDQRVRVSLDTNLTFVREDNLDGKARCTQDEWRRPDMGIDYPFNYLDPDDILRFPYAVLETKLQTHLGQEPPKWLEDLVKSHLVHEVPRFSKYLHGACHFYRDRMPLLPWWLSELEFDIRRPRATNFGLSRSKSFKPLIDGQYRRAFEKEEQRMTAVAYRANSLSRTPTKGVGDVDMQMSNEDLLKQPNYRASAETLSDSRNLQPSKEKLLAGTTSGDNEAPLFLVTDSSSGGQPQRDQDANIQLYEAGRPIDVDMEELQTQGDLTAEDKKRGYFSRLLGKAGNSTVIPLKKVRVEPKVFFANERTFISWLQFCALLLTVALSLLNFGDDVSRIAGGIFIGIAALVAIYALYRFEKRAWMINRRIIGRYDDVWGPLVLCILLVGALIVNFYLRFR